MPDRKPLPGKFVWYEHVSNNPKKAQAFFAEVFGWKVQPFPVGSASYDMIWAGETADTMLGGYPPPRSDRPAHWVSYVSVEDVDSAAKAAAASGGKILEPPHELPGVGRSVHIADPQGAELSLFKNTTGDPPDAEAIPGRFFWNELHTTDPKSALAFYERVVGFTHTTMDSPGGAYYVLSSKDGVGRGGVTHFLAPGAPPHWVPYVFVDDPDATIARAKKLGAKIPMPVDDIPDVGRLGVLHDPTGAVLAVMKPLPRQKR